MFVRLLILLAIVGCSNAEPVSDSRLEKEPKRIEQKTIAHEIIRREDVPIDKVVYNIRVEFIAGKTPNEQQLAAISRQLKAQEPDAESVFVYFYLPGYDSANHQAFAGAHHVLESPMKVEIHTKPIPPNKETIRFGLSETARKALYRDLIDLDRRSLDWKSDDGLEAARLKIFRKHGIRKNLYWKIANEGGEKGWSTK